jgi:hypothetical protein
MRTVIPPLVLMCSLFLGGCKHLPKFSFGSKSDPAAGETEKDRSKRETAESAFLAECAKLGAIGSVVTGTDGWFFDGAELKKLGATPVVGSNTFAAAVSAISDYRRQLKSNGTELIVAVVPPKSLIFADKLSKEIKVPTKKGAPVPLDSYYAAAVEALSRKEVNVVYPNERFLKERDGKAGPVYAPGAGDLTAVGARLLAEEIRGVAKLSSGESAFVAQELAGQTETAWGGKPSKITQRQIFKNDGTSTLSFGETGGSILVLSDNSALAGKSANTSLAHQLSFEFQRPVGIMTSANARNAQRLKIMRLGTTAKNPLGGTKLVIWICQAADLATGDWDLVPLKLEFKMADPTLRLTE